MKVGIIPRYPMWGASSRLRAYPLQKALCELGHHARIGSDGHEDVLVIQKSPDYSWIERAKAHPGTVVFDYDDREVYQMLPHWQGVADCFTTDTEGHAEEAGVGAHVVPDMIDICPDAPLPLSQGSGVLWYAASITYPAAEEWVKKLAEATIPVNVISHPDRANVAGGRVSFTPWNLHTLSADVRSAAVAILSHWGGMDDPGKSNDKMTFLITHGVPCIVSDTPEYGKLARACGLDWSIMQNGDDIVRAYSQMMDLRQEYLAKAQPYVWERYHPHAVAKRWLEVVS